MNVVSFRLPVRTALFDLILLALLYFIPALSHLTGIPLWFAEPMRLIVVLAIAHTSRFNAYLMALTLPLFSFAASGHPLPPKMLLIMAELFLNVWFFYLLTARKLHPVPAMLVSILVSKAFYYLVKYLLLSYVLLEGSLVSTPLWIQAVSLTVFSLYLVFPFRKSGLGESA